MKSSGDFKTLIWTHPSLPPTPPASSQIPARSALDFCEIHVPQSASANRRIKPSGSWLPAASSGQLELVCLRDQICTSGDPTASCSPNRSSPDGTRRKIYRCFPRPASALLLPHKPRKTTSSRYRWRYRVATPSSCMIFSLSPAPIPILERRPDAETSHARYPDSR